MIKPNSIQIPAQFVELARGWAGDVGSMLRAVESTGNLITGSHRPAKCADDRQWYLHLWRELSSEICKCRMFAESKADDPADKHGLYAETAADAPALKKFEEFADQMIACMENEWGLADWD